MNHWVAQALSLLMALCLFLPCFAAAEEAAQTAVTIDFEDGNAAAFSQSGSCTVGVTESQAHSGKQSLRVSGRGSNNWDAVDLSAASVGIEAGAKVHLSACVYVESSEDGAMAIGKAGGDYAYYAQVNVKGKEWTEISCDFEADAGINIRFLTASDNYLGKNYCIDDVTLTITAPEKVDYSDAPQIHYTSDFTSGTDGWYARSAGGAAIETTADGLFITGRTATWNSPGRDFDLVPGRTYNLSVQVKQDELDSCSFILSVVLSVLLGLGVTGGLLMPKLLYTEIIDEDQSVTGLRREGAFYGIQAFIIRFASGLQAVILSLIMGIFGYVEGAQTQVASAATGFKVAMSFLPAGLVLIGCLIITRYPLYGERLAQVKQKIAAGGSAEQ